VVNAPASSKSWPGRRACAVRSRSWKMILFALMNAAPHHSWRWGSRPGRRSVGQDLGELPGFAVTALGGHAGAHQAVEIQKTDHVGETALGERGGCRRPDRDRDNTGSMTGGEFAPLYFKAMVAGRQGQALLGGPGRG